MSDKFNGGAVIGRNIFLSVTSSSPYASLEIDGDKLIVKAGGRSISLDRGEIVRTRWRSGFFFTGFEIITSIEGARQIIFKPVKKEATVFANAISEFFL